MSTAVSSPPKKKRRLLKASIILAVVMLALAAGMLVYLNSHSFQETVRRRVALQLERMTGGKVEIQSLDWKLSTLQFEIRNLTIHGLEAPGEAPYVHADRLSAALRIVSFFSRKVALRNVSVDRLVVHLIIYPDGSTNQPTPPRSAHGAGAVEGGISPGELFQLSVNRVEISNSTLILNQEQIPFELTGERLAAGIAYAPREKGYETSVSMSVLSGHWRDIAPQRADVDLQILLRHTDAVIKSLQVTAGRSTLQASGALRNYNNPEITLQVAAVIDLPQVAKMARMLQVRAGQADVKGTLDYRNKRYSLQGNLGVKGLEWKDEFVRVVDVAANSPFSVTPEKISLSRLAAQIFGGNTQAEVEVTNWGAVAAGKKAQPQKGTARIRMAGLELNRIATALDLRDLPLEKMQLAGGVSGEIKGGWTGSPQKAQADISLDVAPPQTVAAQQVPVTAHLRATYHGGRRLLDVSQLNVATRAIHASASGELGSEAAQARVAVTATSLQELRPVLAALRPGTHIPVLLEGRATYNGTISGPLEALSTHGHLELGNFDTEFPRPQPPAAAGHPSEQRVHWDSLAADLAYSPSMISLQHGVLRRGRGQMDFSVSVALHKGAFDENTSQVNANFHAQNANIEALQALFGLDYPLAGFLAGDFKASGTVANLRGNGSLVINQMTALGEPFRQLRAQVQLAGKQVELTNISLAHNGAQVTGAFAYDFGNRNFRFDLAGDSIELATLHRLELPRLAMEGKATFHLAGSGTEEAPVLNGQLELRDLVLNHELVGGMKITAETRGADLLLSGRSNFATASLTLDGTVQLRGDCPGQMTLKFARLDFDPLIRAYLQGQVTGHSSIAGTIRIRGPFRRPRDLVITGVADQLSAELENVKLQNDGPVHFSMDSEVARLDQFHLVGENTDVYVQGGVRLSGDYPLDLRTRGRFNLKLLQGYQPDIVSYGPATFTVDIAGPAAHPQFSGRMDLVDAYISAADLPNGLSHINGTLVFVQDRVQIEKLTAQTGGGALNVGGFLAFRNGLYFDLTATGKDVRLRYPPGVSASADASLRYTGSIRNSLLSGEITVTRFGVNPKFDFGMYLAQSRKSPMYSINPFLDNLRLDVHITSTPELRVETSLAKLSGDLDLHLRGTFSRPAVLGRVNIAEGDIFFNGTKYRLERGDVTFSNPLTIEPVVNIEMSARVQDYDVTIGLHGTATGGKGLSMNYRSDPPLSNADIIALLAFGRTRGQGLYNAAQPGQAGSDTASASNVILGQALNATFTDRVQRLFGASRVKIDPQFVGSENNPSARVTLEQTISNNITLTYITSLTQSAEAVVQVEYNINKNISIVAVRDQNGVLGFDVRIRRRRK